LQNNVIDMGHIERKQREKENIRKSILQAALDIAVAEGWQGVTIRKIANAVEYTTSIVYGHFESKEALLQEISDNGFTTLYNRFIRALGKELNPRKQLMALSLANWDFAVENSELYQLMFDFGKPAGKVANKTQPLVKDIFVRLVGKSEADISSLMLNWICLRQGAIAQLMNFTEQEEMTKEDARKLYAEFIRRFISSITD